MALFVSLFFRKSRFWLNVCCFSFLVVSSFPVVHGERPYVASKCMQIISSSTDKHPVLFLHGLTDIKETWEGINEYTMLLTGRQVCIYDLRNHGDSFWNDTFNVDVLAEDLGNFMKGYSMEKASLVGHSLGGLTIMKFALKNPEKVESIFVEDIAPDSVTVEMEDYLANVSKVALDSISQVPNDASEEEVRALVTDYFVKETGFPPEEYLFKRSPFHRINGVWQWKANFEAFRKAYGQHGYIAGKFEGVYNGNAYFIYGKASPLRVKDHEAEIKKLFPEAHLFGVEGAGHFVHFNKTLYRNHLAVFLNGKDLINTFLLLG